MNYRIFLNLSLVAVAALTLTACQGKESSSSKTAAPGKNATVIATVNGATITTDDYDREVKALPEYIRAMADTPQGKKEMIETLVMRELILQQAAKDGVDKSKEVEEKLAELKKRVVVDIYLQKKVENDTKISDEELKSFYEKNLDKFKAGEQVKASHILVKTEQEAKDVLAQLKSGAKFEELAKSKSVDSSATQGGDLGWFGKGNMVPVFEKTAFALKEGELSGIVKSEFGFHIIKLTGKRPAGTRPFEEAREQIKTALLPQKQQQVFMQLKDDLRKGAKVEIKDQAPAAAPAPAVSEPRKPADTPQPATDEKK